MGIFVYQPTGIPGANGKTVLSGSGVPASETGHNGDFYLDLTSDTNDLYGPKTGGAWPGSPLELKGETGDTGATGITAFDAGATYPAAALVEHSLQLYRASAEIVGSEDEPGSPGSDWQLIGYAFAGAIPQTLGGEDAAAKIAAIENALVALGLGTLPG